MKEKFSGKQILILTTCLLLVAIVAIGFLFFGKDIPTLGPTTFAIKELPSDEVKLSEETITLKTKCDIKNPEITWSCSNENKATVKDGVITLHEAGIVIVEAEVVGTDLSDEVIISIINDVPVPANGVEIVNKPTETITFEEQTIYLTHQLLPDNATYEEVVYTSSDESIAKVDAAGKVTIVAPGTVDIRVALESNAEIYDECTLDIAWDRILSDDGTFEGKKGTVSLYSPSVTDEITNEQYKFQNLITFKKIKKNDGTSALSVVSEGEAWDTLFVKFDQKIKKGETYLISYNADWKANAVPKLYGYAIIPDTGNWVADEPDNIVNFSTDVKWYDGMVQIPFTANADMNRLYLVLVNQDSNVNMNMTMDNIRLTSADGVVLSSAVYNDDGTFEGKPGNISVFSAHALELGAEGYGWSSQVTLDKVKNGNGNAIKVTSSGEHNIDYLYIKVDTPIKKNYKYTVTMDLEALDEQCKNGNYGYWILSPKANVEEYVQFFQEVDGKDLFKKDATFEFVSNGEYEYFYLVLREYTLEDSGEADAKFNFMLDNIQFKEVGYMGETSYLNDDGTFEGVKGNISFYSPTVTNEIKKETYHPYNLILFKQIANKDGTHALSIESTGSNWDTLFMKFDVPIKRGTTYEITYDAVWNGEKEPATYGYAVMPSTENWVTDEVSNMVNYTSDVAWFDGHVKIRFTANADIDSWYLTLVVQDADVALNMNIDNIRIENVGAGAVYDDDGTFEGVSGKYSLLSPHDINGAFGFGWAPTLTFKELTNSQGTKYAVTSSGDNEMDLLYIKVDKKIKQNGKYTVTMDLEPLDNAQITGSWYYWICSPDAVIETGNGKAVIQDAQNVASNKFFKEDSEFVFTANADYDYFYILICENGASGGHVPFNFSIDNIALESDESAVKPTDESKFVKEVALSGNGPTYSLTNLEPGTKYKLTVSAVGSPSVVVSNNKNGAVYDGVSFYSKTKLITADKDEDDKPTGTYSVVFETAAIDFDEVTLTISGTYSNPKLYEESRVEIQNIPAKNQLAVGGNCDLDSVLIGLDNAGAVTWKSSNESVAEINSDGLVTTKKIGKTEITATVSEDGEKYEAYMELYVVNASLGADAYGLIMDAASPTDFTLQIPANEKIRVMQISDTQIIYPYDLRYEGMLSASEIKRWGGENALYEHCFVYMEKSFEILEKSGKLPHLIVLAGDNIYGHFDDDGAMLDALITKMDELCKKYDIYWTFVFGNHDKESDIGIEEILRKYSNSAYCLYAYRNVSGDSNMSVAIKQDNEYKQIVYMFDTHNTGSASGTNQKGNRVDEYATLLAGIYDSQTEWFQSVADVYKNVPSLVYMHIAFEEYARTFAGHGYGVTYDEITTSSMDAVVTKNNTYGDFGELHEQVSIWDDNPEKEGTDFYKMLTDYNVTGVFCGHNHKNNYSVVTEDDIRLTFGLKSSTYDAYYEGLLGGTLVTTEETQMDVEHIYAVAKISESILNDDGTFEGNAGNISLYSAKDVSTAYGSGWSNDLTFEQTTGLNNNYVTVRSNGEHSYDNRKVRTITKEVLYAKKKKEG